MTTITIHLADSDPPEDISEYVHLVADLIAEGYTSGHTDRETHWDSDLRP